MAEQRTNKKSSGGGGNKNRNRNRNRNRNKKAKQGAALDKPKRVGPLPADDVKISEPKNYGVLFFDTLDKAKTDLEKIKAKLTEYDQLNVIVRHEANMDDPEFALDGIKLFAGTAWALIHERRVEDGWYKIPQ